MKVYNGEGIILGRLASAVAKDLLLGEEVSVVNCEKIIISGNKAGTVALQKQRRERRGHPYRAQEISRLPELFVKRSIRGMLPWKQSRGKEAFRRVRCYRGVPMTLSSDMIVLSDHSFTKLPTLKYLPVGEVVKKLGGTR